MKFHNLRLVLSFVYALRGIGRAVKYEANMRVHLVAGALALVGAAFLKIMPYEWLILFLTITLVIFAELINTALEANVDLVTKESRPEARLAKDVAAGAVLFASANAVVVGLVIFVPKIFPGVF
ncbi:diacylglycerol kinase [Candidatus Termititenax persephonae]|uniref:Diacylglycerol kinase n=1 Tax=Candidatus Termititenax persephonae TaxID=2218525 RepID=A0A388THG0_9BACT|nr:diacylglycerol kinase [Candidatus Termititenax persephonae]